MKAKDACENRDRLGLAVGLSREEITDLRHITPAVRFAVEAYVQFARRHPWQESVSASLTELFAPVQRLATWPEHYPWIDGDGLLYFRNRVTQAQRDVEHGLGIIRDYFRTREQQLRALNILNFELDVFEDAEDT